MERLGEAKAGFRSLTEAILREMDSSRDIWSNVLAA
jgi:hypothetical protein